MTARPTADAWRALSAEVRTKRVVDLRRKAQGHRGIARQYEREGKPGNLIHLHDAMAVADDAVADALASLGPGDGGTCCADLAYHLATGQTCCDRGTGCPDVVIIRTKDGGLGLPIHDGGSSWIEIAFCPWCGAAAAPTEGGKGEAP